MVDKQALEMGFLLSRGPLEAAVKVHSRGLSAPGRLATSGSNLTLK